METRAQDESVLKDLRYYLVNLEYRHDLQNVGRGSPDTVPEIVITVIEGCWHVNPTERKTVQRNVSLGYSCIFISASLRIVILLREMTVV